VYQLSLDTLLDYTDWEREKWGEWFRKQGAPVLQISAGAHGDGRFESVGDLVRHIFSAEKRYVERLSGQALTDPASIPGDDVEALFEFSRGSRRALKELIDKFPFDEWNSAKDFNILSYAVSASPAKIVIHILIHEIRHWAQIGTVLRLNGLVAGFHDFLFSPVTGEFSRE
jgi:uncharacterized damage-inducible protein DinB